MPLLDSEPDNSPDNSGAEARFPELAKQDLGEPGFLDVAAAAERTSNTVGQLYDRTFTHPQPDAEAIPGFNPIDHIPAGYLHDYGDRFLSAQNPAEMAWIKQGIDSERQDQQILARAGGWGIAASLAGGMTDPLTIASMALVPEAAPTRIGNAVRWALTNAAATAGQEAIGSSLSETRTMGQSALNVGAGAVLGSVLGPLARRVPAAEFDRVSAALTPELKPGGPETVLGPNQRSILNDVQAESGHYVAARGVVNEANTALAEHEQSLRAIVEGPEGQAAQPAAGVNELSDKQVSVGREALNEAASVISASKADQVADETARLTKLGFEDAADRATKNVEKTRDAAQAKAESARTLLGIAEPDTAQTWKVPGAQSDLEQLLYTVGHAKNLDEALEALPGPLRDSFRRRLIANETPAHTLDVHGNLLEAEKPPEAPAAPPEAEHALPGEPAYVNPEGASTAGAAAISEPGLADLTTAKGGVVISKTIGKVAPAARLLNQPSLVARKLTADLVNIPGELAQNFKDVANPNPIERKLWGYEGVHMEGMRQRRQAFGQYVARARKEGTPPISRRQFMDTVAMAMRRGDLSAIPEVTQAAKATRATIFQPLYDRALKLGMLPQEAKLYADSYLMRRYDIQKINGDFKGWINTLREGFIRQGADPAEATDIAYQATRNIRSNERGTMDWKAMDGIVPKSGQMKERTLTLPDQLLEPYLSNDIDDLSHAYLRSMAPEVEMTERFGSRDLKDQFKDIQDEYARLMEQQRVAGNNDAVLKLQNQQNATIRDLSAMRDRLYGTYGAPADPGNFFIRAGRLLRAGNVFRLLGAATLSHIPDLGNIMARYGMPNTFTAMAKFTSSLDAMKLAYSEAQRMGHAIDMSMNVTASILGDYGNHSRFAEQRVAQNLTRFFTIVTGETPLITASQTLTSVMAQDELLRAAQKVAGGGALAQMQGARLAAAGIDRDTLVKIAEQATGKTQTLRGLRFGMSDTWEDQGIAKAFESAVSREAHAVTLRPGVGDTPLLMSTEWGKLILQFKTFAFAANRAVLLPMSQGIAHGDPRSSAALLALASMGTLSYVAKQKAAGQPLEANPGRLAMEIADKTNLLGWTNEVISPSLWQAGASNFSRWSDRDAAETIGGPTLGTIASAYIRQLPGRTANLASGGALNPQLPFRRSDLHFLRRMAPAQNLWYMRNGINFLEDRVGDAFGLPGESNEDRQVAADASREAAGVFQ